jgi:hypothetical protein
MQTDMGITLYQVATKGSQLGMKAMGTIARKFLRMRALLAFEKALAFGVQGLLNAI